VQRAANDLSGKKSNRSAFVFGGAIGLLAILFHSVVDFNMHVPANAILAVTLMALTTSHLRFTSDRYWIRLRVLGRVLLAVEGCVAASYLGLEGVRQYREAVWLQKAEPLKDNSNEKIAMLKRAFAVEPQNFQTPYDIGEAYRVQSWQGNDDYQALAEEAMKWFQKSMERNPYYGYNYLRYGMCLDWIGKKNEAAPYFKRAEQLDPNGYFTVAHQGWHLLNLGEYTAAQPYFERSLRLKSDNNPVARKYLEVIHRKLLEASGGK
jgi:tetratricopeptide (TPR) repeat protein